MGPSHFVSQDFRGIVMLVTESSREPSDELDAMEQLSSSSELSCGDDLSLGVL